MYFKTTAHIMWLQTPQIFRIQPGMQFIVTTTQLFISSNCCVANLMITSIKLYNTGNASNSYNRNPSAYWPSGYKHWLIYWIYLFVVSSISLSSMESFYLISTWTSKDAVITTKNIQWSTETRYNLSAKYWHWKMALGFSAKTSCIHLYSVLRE